MIHLVPKPAHRSPLPRVVWATAWVSFFADFSTELIYGVLPAYYLHTISLSILSLGLIEGLAESIVALTKLMSGSISDRTGRRPLWMLAGYGLSGIAKPMIALVSSGFGIGALRAADRFGKGIRGAPRDAMVSSAVDEKDRGRAFGIQRALDHSGALVGGLVAAGLLAGGFFVPRQLFMLSAIPGAIAVLVIIFFVREPKDSIYQPKPVNKKQPFSLLSAWTEATTELKRYLVPAAIFALANASDILLLAISYQQFIASGYSESTALAMLPLLWALLHVVKSIGSSYGGRLSDRIGRVLLIRIAWMVYALTYALAAVLAAGGASWIAWVMFTVYGVYTILAEAPEKALIADLAPDPSARGSAYGLVHFVTGILALPATLLASGLWLWLSPAWAFGTGAALALLASGLLGTLRLTGIDQRPR
jgi:MFS family permease